MVMMSMIGQAGEPAPPTAASAVVAAHADLSRFPADIRANIRYLRRPPMTTDKEWATLAATLSGHCNGLSTRGDIRRPAPVGSQLLRIQLSHYGWTPATWDSLPDPYAVADARAVKLVDVQREYVWPGGVWEPDGKHYEKGAFKFKQWVKEPVAVDGSKVTAAVAPWMSEGVKEQMADLATWTYSVVPIVR